ncbi:hypothetical protein BDA96_01G280500 [Sorghum bicolor]|uniref:Uncharacterized protein n=2 Tax=Sorghum bicolor TaxID=4558 RepID=A0A921S1N7_SORBI|nr:hypothetical protein BDA96_01G280500 [Sorghum bicolor]
MEGRRCGSRVPRRVPRHSDYFNPRAPPRGDGCGYGRPPNSVQDGRVFTSYNIYKGKAALSFDPRPPYLFQQVEEVGLGFVVSDIVPYMCCANDACVAKEGYVLLQFAPAVATRQYDWTRKQFPAMILSSLSICANGIFKWSS